MLDLQQLRDEFTQRYGLATTISYFSPGRVNLIGEHIDYNGGYVLPGAISLGISAIVSKRSDSLVRVYSKEFNQEVIIDTQNESIVTEEDRHTHWSDYIASTLQVLSDNGVELFGADILLDSDLPLGSGLSSSAALECLIAFIFNEHHYTQYRTELALDAQRAEREYVGVNCGIMDQFVVSNGKKNNALLLNCATLEFEYIPIDLKQYELIIINSNKPRELASSKYNERRRECDKAFELLSAIDPAEDLCHMHEISLGYLEDDLLYMRAKHAVLENKRVIYAAEALKKGNIELFGQLLTESHRSLDADYEVSCEELNIIVHYSTHFEGCIGARMTGAGFGGCCIALVEKDKSARFMNYVLKKYEEKTGIKAKAYIAEIADGVKRIA